MTARSIPARLLRATAAGTFALITLAAAVAPAPPIARAQTGGPTQPGADVVITVPAGTPTVDAQVQATAPDGVPAITAAGVIALVPASAQPGTLSSVTSDLGNGAAVTLLVAADPTPRYVRIQAITAASGTIPAAVALTGTALAFSIDLYDASTGAAITEYPPITAGVRVPTDIDPATLAAFRFDETTTNIEMLGVTPDPTTRVIQFPVIGRGTYLFGVAAQ